MSGRFIIGTLFVAGLATVLIAEQQSGSTANPATDPHKAGQTAGAADQNSAARRQGSPQAADEVPSANQTPDQKFVNCMARANLFEIQAGKLVAGKASNERVKKMAQMMIDDHTKAQAQLRQAAQKSGLQVPEGLLTWQQAKLDYTSRVPAEDLEAGYSFHLVAAHHMALLETQRAAAKSQDEGIKDLARNLGRDLRGHLQQANSLAMEFTGGQGTGISGEPVSPNSTTGGGSQQQGNPGTDNK